MVKGKLVTACINNVVQHDCYIGAGRRWRNSVLVLNSLVQTVVDSELGGRSTVIKTHIIASLWFNLRWECTSLEYYPAASLQTVRACSSDSSIGTGKRNGNLFLVHEIRNTTHHGQLRACRLRLCLVIGHERILHILCNRLEVLCNLTSVLVLLWTIGLVDHCHNIGHLTGNTENLTVVCSTANTWCHRELVLVKLRTLVLLRWAQLISLPLNLHLDCSLKLRHTGKKRS